MKTIGLGECNIRQQQQLLGLCPGLGLSCTYFALEDVSHIHEDVCASHNWCKSDCMQGICPVSKIN